MLNATASLSKQANNSSGDLAKRISIVDVPESTSYHFAVSLRYVIMDRTTIANSLSDATYCFLMSPGKICHKSFNAQFGGIRPLDYP